MVTEMYHTLFIYSWLVRFETVNLMCASLLVGAVNSKQVDFSEHNSHIKS